MRLKCKCGKVLKIKDELAGKRIRCPGCKAAISVPSLAKDEAPVAPEPEPSQPPAPPEPSAPPAPPEPPQPPALPESSQPEAAEAPEPEAPPEEKKVTTASYPPAMPKTPAGPTPPSPKPKPAKPQSEWLTEFLNRKIPMPLFLAGVVLALLIGIGIGMGIG